jgi:peptidoglycan/LPS O-acetylase OafA/YrhL
MSTTLPNRAYYPALDGLRGIGCLLVVTYHNFPFIHEYLFFGWLAMDIFFVLSGFLITDILLNTFGEKNYLKNFYVRRLLRVFPLYYTSLVVFLLILPHINGLPVRLDYFVDNQVYFWTFTQNWLMIFFPGQNQYALNHLWSMAVEEQFYLLWPLVVATVRKPKILFGMLAVLLLGVIVLRFWLWVNKIEGLAYYNLYTFTRIDGICVGCMVALLQKINRNFLQRYMALIVFGFAAFNFIFYLVNLQYNDSFPYLALVGFSTFSMIFGLLVYDIVNVQTKIWDRIFNIEVLKFLGRISYGTYIFHWPLYLILHPFLMKWAKQFMLPVSAQFFTSISATILAYSLGYLSYRYFELRFLKLKKHFA